MDEFNQILTWFFDPISTSDFELDRYCHCNSDDLECESSTIGFVGPNHLSLYFAHLYSFFRCTKVLLNFAFQGPTDKGYVMPY